MDNILPQTVQLAPSQTYRVELNSRGALGLQLLYRTNEDSIVTITKDNTTSNNSDTVLPGEAIKIAFDIKAVSVGTVTITFYETQPWNKNFKEIIQRQLIIAVKNP